jgi:WD40 repeat protein
MAVGTDKGPTNHRHDAALIEMWNGTVWSVQTSARPAGARITDLYGVSCTSPASCMAVGTYEPAGEISFSTGMAEEWNGRTWTVQKTAAEGSGGQLDGVSCPSATDCVAVGNGLDDLLVEVWNGSTWTAQPILQVNVSRFGLLTDVSCSSTTACMTVGYYYSDKGYKSGIAEQWNGSVWTIRPTLKHRGIDLSEVSCVSASACTAVGIHDNGIAFKTLIEAWNGTAWVVQTSPDPSPNGNYLYGVSCTAAATCTTVGFTGANVPLIESEGT